jgi:hypothetical protein
MPKVKIYDIYLILNANRIYNISVGKTDTG